MKNLLIKLNKLKAANPLAIELFLNSGKTQYFKKGTLLNSSEHNYTMLYFVEEGLVRGFIHHLANEHTLWILDKGFIIPSNGDFSKRKFPEYIEFLKNTEVWCINLNNAKLNGNSNPVFYQILFEVYEEAIFVGKTREALLRLPDAKDRYIWFKTKNISLFHQLTIHILSSYLRMSPKQFSRIKNEDTHQK